METIKVAVPVAEGRLTAHFGHCAAFAVVDVDAETKKVLKTEELIPPPHEPGLLPKWLGERKVRLVIAGGMGRRAQELFQNGGITVVTGAPAHAPVELVTAYFAGTLQTGANGCDH